MFAVGHMSVSYLLTRGLQRNKLKPLSITIVWICSLLPDADLLIPGIKHQGPTHSIFFAFAAFLPLFLVLGARVTPYFLGFVSHTILGDLITNRGIMFLWPLTTRYMSINIPGVHKPTFAGNFELVVFVLFIVFFVFKRDFTAENYVSNQKPLLIIPFLALIAPVVFGFPIPAPVRLLWPHVIFTVIVLKPFYLHSLIKKINHADLIHL